MKWLEQNHRTESWSSLRRTRLVVFFGREVQEARNDAHDNGVLEDDFDKWEAKFNSICAVEWEKRVKSAALT